MCVFKHILSSALTDINRKCKWFDAGNICPCFLFMRIVFSSSGAFDSDMIRQHQSPLITMNELANLEVIVFKPPACIGVPGVLAVLRLSLQFLIPDCAFILHWLADKCTLCFTSLWAAAVQNHIAPLSALYRKTLWQYWCYYSEKVHCKLYLHNSWLV